MRKGALTRPARNKLLAEMTDEVGGLVLANNYQQTLALSLQRKRGLADLPHQARFMAALEARGLLDRAVETLPSDAALAERAGARRAADAGRTRRAARLCQDRAVLRHRRQRRARRSAFRARPAGLFPGPHGEEICRRDRAATGCAARSSRASLANDLVNRGGPSFVTRLQDADRAQRRATWCAPSPWCATASRCRRSIAEIDALDNQIDGQVQLDLYAVGRPADLRRPAPGI